MKKFISILLIMLMIFTMTACGEKNVNYEPKDYIVDVDYTDDFRLLVLGDTHLSNKDNRDNSYAIIRTTIENSDCDMIHINGDVFTFADKRTVKEFCKFIDSFGVPWTLTFGNHDEQCYFSIDWLTRYLNNFGSNCKFHDIKGDNVYGYANYAINLVDGEDVIEQLIIFDSNRYYMGDYWGYDWIHEDQIEWYNNLVKYSRRFNGTSPLPSIAFFHIPFPEFDYAWQECQSVHNKDVVLEYGTNNEPVCCPDYNSGLFDAMLKGRSTKAVICSHDHYNNSRINYKGIQLQYAIKADDRIYYDENMIGGMVIVIHRDSTLDYEYHYHTYEEALENAEK